MPWFTTKGQIFQLLFQIFAATLAAFKAWPDMMTSNYLSGGAILFYSLISLVLGSILHLITIRRSPASAGNEVYGHGSPALQNLTDRLIEAREAAVARDQIIIARNETIRQLTDEVEKLRSAPSKVDSKLTIHSAVYGVPTIEDVEVTEKLRDAIGDALAIRVNNDLVPHDPAHSETKRLEVEYSYGTRERKIVSRPEYELMVLPEDSWLEKELRTLRDKVSAATTLKHPPLAKLALKYDTVLNHRTSHDESDDSFEVLWVRNTQLSIPFVAQYVSARIRFTLDDGAESCTITETQWIYEHTDRSSGFIGNSRPSWVDIEGNESQALVLAVKQSDGTIKSRDSKGATVHYFRRDTSWNATIILMSDNTETVTLKTKLTVYPNGTFKWAPVGEAESE
ncbi:MAG: hypothetical protein ABI833_21825 [Acidobacteriota bacterium]